MMKIQWWSKTKIGQWASVFTLLFVVLMAVKASALAVFIRLPLPSPIIAVLGILGFILGIVSLVKLKDRSVFVLLSIPVGLLILFWIAAEMLYPH